MYTISLKPTDRETKSNLRLKSCLHEYTLPRPFCIIDKPPSIHTPSFSPSSTRPSVIGYLSPGLSLTPRLLRSVLSRRFPSPLSVLSYNSHPSLLTPFALKLSSLLPHFFTPVFCPATSSSVSPLCQLVMGEAVNKTGCFGVWLAGEEHSRWRWRWLPLCLWVDKLKTGETQGGPKSGTSLAGNLFVLQLHSSWSHPLNYVCSAWGIALFYGNKWFFLLKQPWQCKSSGDHPF